MLPAVNRLLQLSAMQLLSYDTTFKLGDYYVSPFLFVQKISSDVDSCMNESCAVLMMCS